MNETRPIILTARPDDQAQAFFDAKRTAFFPPDRNYLDAHLTMFHALPPDNLDKISQDIQPAIDAPPPLQAKASDIMFMGFGSAYIIDCPQLVTIRQQLVEKWGDDLSPQDRQKFKPHITFQNKVDADTAKAVYHEQSEVFEPFDFQITGLSLWYYDMGPWVHIRDLAFQA